MNKWFISKENCKTFISNRVIQLIKLLIFYLRGTPTVTNIPNLLAFQLKKTLLATCIYIACLHFCATTHHVPANHPSLQPWLNHKVKDPYDCFFLISGRNMINWNATQATRSLQKSLAVAPTYITMLAASRMKASAIHFRPHTSFFTSWLKY